MMCYFNKSVLLMLDKVKRWWEKVLFCSNVSMIWSRIYTIMTRVTCSTPWSIKLFIYPFSFLREQVVRARKKDTGMVYAMKIMDKKFLTKENKTSYVKLERIVLDQLDHPGVVRLYFTFQDSFSLCKYCHTTRFLFLIMLVEYSCVRLIDVLEFDILKTWGLNPVMVANFLIK